MLGSASGGTDNVSRREIVEAGSNPSRFHCIHLHLGDHESESDIITEACHIRLSQNATRYSDGPFTPVNLGNAYAQ